MSDMYMEDLRSWVQTTLDAADLDASDLEDVSNWEYERCLEFLQALRMKRQLCGSKYSYFMRARIAQHIVNAYRFLAVNASGLTIRFGCVYDLNAIVRSNPIAFRWIIPLTVEAT